MNNPWAEKWYAWKLCGVAWARKGKVYPFTTYVVDQDGEWNRIWKTRFFYKENSINLSFA